MKKILFLATIVLLTFLTHGQQALSTRVKMSGTKIQKDSVVLTESLIKELLKTDMSDKKETKKMLEKFLNKKSELSFKNVTNWGIVGIGNLNTEAFNDINASGKFTGYKRLNKSINSFTTIYFSFNKNASNNDSLLAGTFLFTDVGNSSATLTLEHSIKLGLVDNTVHLICPFIEFATKNIKVGSKDSIKQFQTLNYVIGARYQNWNIDPNSEFDVSFSATPYLALVNVPDEDNDDYRYLFKSPNLKSEIWSLGFRFTVQFNNFQAFADLRQVLGSKENVPLRELRGFNSNIGIVFNADIFEK